MVFMDCRVSEFQPIFDFVPFIVGIAEPIRSVTTRTLYDQLVFEGIGYNGFAVLNFCDAYGHFSCYWTAARCSAQIASFDMIDAPNGWHATRHELVSITR
jgi:hypothetical protein